MQFWGALPFGNLTEFPSPFVTSSVASSHFNPFTLIPGPPELYEDPLVADSVASQVMLLPLVLVCLHCLAQQPLPGLQDMALYPREEDASIPSLPG